MRREPRRKLPNLLDALQVFWGKSRLFAREIREVEKFRICENENAGIVCLCFQWPNSWKIFPPSSRSLIPDLWQQQAVAALREGRDVVVQAPTGAGKTLIFELWSKQGKNRGQAIYTVPTRALANDKLAEWRARGWEVGIATGDLSENLSAPVIVATLETQKHRLIGGDGPALLVVDEYQMLGDPDRGLNYELALALAPPRTQLLLLSGSVANPQHVVKWLERLGRQAVLIRHEERPVPLEEVNANNLNYHLPAAIQGYWPRLAAKALAEDLGPILIFSPHRQSAESLAAELARTLPVPNPLSLSAEQKTLAGEPLAKMLKSRVAYHHSGLSYAARAGVVEPLAKAGQLRVVVATMGLAAGINFSLRSVALAAESYKRDHQDQLLRADEILQMFGRAGRRGLDETGFILITANQLRLLDARPVHLARGGLVDWNALLGLMAAAADQGGDPLQQAVRVQERLFTTKPVTLGIEQSMKHPRGPVRPQHGCRARPPCPPAGLPDAKQPRRMAELSAAAGHPPAQNPGHAGGRFRLWASPRFHSILSEAAALEKVGPGILCVLSEDAHGKTYGRAITVADRLNHNRVLLNKWVRRLIHWEGRQAPLEVWSEKIVPLLEQKLAAQKTPLVRMVDEWRAHHRPPQHRRPDFARAGGQPRGGVMETAGARSPARRLRPMFARARLPRASHRHRRGLALAAAGSHRGLRRANAARARGRLFFPGRRAGHRRRAGG